MPVREHTYFFGRLHLLGRDHEDKDNLILAALRAPGYIEDGKFRYRFADTEELEIEDQRFVHGLLVKYKPLLEGEVVDEAASRIVEGGLPQGVVAKAPFFIHFDSSIVAYRPIAAKISDNQFRRLFCGLLEEAHDRFFISAKIDPITEELQILNAIEQLDEILMFKVELVPTNPSNRDEYRNLDERIRQLKADRFREEISSKSGLDKDALREDPAYSGIFMAQDGYGTASILGISDGRSVTVSTEDSPTTGRAVIADSARETLHSLLGVFRRIWNRTSDVYKD